MGANPEYAEGEVIANKYVVEGLLGESPAGRVYLANGNFGSQKICVKFYRSEVSDRLLAAPDFFLKAAAISEIEHDNLCAGLDVQEEMGKVFVARAYAEGQSFDVWLREARSDGNYFPRGLEVLWQVSQGLTALHERTRHLAIHPGNVIVGPLVAKLCDWDPRALSNMEMTPDALPLRPEFQGYRAPEVSGRGSFLSYPSTDLFAVAGLLYRLVKGDHPNARLAQTLQDIQGFDKDLAVFLAKALHPKPEERFQEAGAFSDALWDLKAAMQRLQDRNVYMASTKPQSAGLQPAAMAAGKSDALFQEAPATSGNDTFFNSFPSAAPAAAPPERTEITPPAARPMSPSTQGDTLFGTPQRPNPVPQPPAPKAPSPKKSGLEDLEAPSGTLFGSSAPLFSAPSKAKPEFETPKSASSKPLAVSLSSLEKDPLDMAGGDATGGFTQFGFKGAGENRTGIFPPEQKAASARTKLLIALAAVGGLVLVMALGGLFLFLRGTAAPKVAEQTAPLPKPEVEPAPVAEPQSTTPNTNAGSIPPATEKVETASRPAPPPVAARTPEPEPAPAMAPKPKPSQPPASPDVAGGKISAEREAALMTMIQTRAWPASASERMRAANDFNDLGKTAEANMAYAKALAAGDVTEKQKILALGGMAVTFQSMGLPDQAKDAVQRILEINPRNGFALKLKESLR